MNYIKPEDIRAYVEQNPQGIAGMSEELSAMVNHFAETAVRECINIANDTRYDGRIVANRIKFAFGVEQ